MNLSSIFFSSIHRYLLLGIPIPVTHGGLGKIITIFQMRFFFYRNVLLFFCLQLGLCLIDKFVSKCPIDMFVSKFQIRECLGTGRGKDKPQPEPMIALSHYSDVMMSALASQITSLTIVRSFRHISKKTSKFRVTGLCEGNSPVSGEFPAHRISNAENVSI